MEYWHSLKATATRWSLLGEPPLIAARQHTHTHKPLALSVTPQRLQCRRQKEEQKQSLRGNSLICCPWIEPREWNVNISTHSVPGLGLPGERR